MNLGAVVLCCTYFTLKISTNQRFGIHADRSKIEGKNGEVYFGVRKMKLKYLDIEMLQSLESTLNCANYDVTSEKCTSTQVMWAKFYDYKVAIQWP